MRTEIIAGRVVAGQTLAVARFLYERADKRRAEAARDEAHAKKILRAQGVAAHTVVTKNMTRLLRMAKHDVAEADRLIDECPAQAQTDETWTG